MKKIIWFYITVTFILFFGNSIIFGAELKVSRVEAYQVISRTTAVLTTAKRIASKGHKYAGMGMAIAHQQLARDLYRNGLYVDAVFHSLRSRVLAAKVMKQNQSELLNEALYDRAEEKYVRNSPVEQDLDQILKASKITIMKDQDAVNSAEDQNL